MTHRTTDLPAQRGYSDEELERRAMVPGFGDSWVAPWATWESEHTGYGRALRTLARYPRALPLLLCADHGVFVSAKVWENERDSPYPVHLTCLSRKRDVLRERYGKTSYHVAHPWVLYRRIRYPAPRTGRRGTLVYFPHSNATATPVFDIDRYMRELEALPEQYQPVVVCLSFHDIHSGVHRVLRKYGLPLVTAGHGNAQAFIDHFYSLLYQFRYATSPNVGTHTFYAMEAGIPFFLMGEYPRIRIRNSTHTDDGEYGEEIRGGDAEESRRLDAFIAMMYERTDEVTPAQMTVVQHYLGLDSPLAAGDIARVVWREVLSFANWRHYLGSLFGRVRQRLAPGAA